MYSGFRFGRIHLARTTINAISISTLGLFIYCTLFALLRYVPAPALAAAVIFGLILLTHAREISDRFILPLLAISCGYVALSYFHALPPAWTTYWEPSFILRQWMWVPLLTLFSSAFCFIFIRYRQFIIRHAWTLLITSFVLGRISLIFSPLSIGFIVKMGIYTLVPENAIFMTLLIICVFFKMKQSMKNLLLLILFFPLFTSAQSLILYGTIILIKFSRMYRTITFVMATGLLAAMIVAPHYVDTIYSIDNSSGFRATLWRDAEDGFLQSHMLGVGFGTEYIRNIFYLPSQFDVWHVTNEWSEDRLLIGTHNTFFDISLKMGIAGLIAFVFWLGNLALPAFKRSNKQLRIDCAIIVMMLLNNCLNMGVTSINFMFCTAICSGWLLASAKHARAASILPPARPAGLA